MAQTRTGWGLEVVHTRPLLDALAQAMAADVLVDELVESLPHDGAMRGYSFFRAIALIRACPTFSAA